MFTSILTKKTWRLAYFLLSFEFRPLFPFKPVNRLPEHNAILNMFSLWSRHFCLLVMTCSPRSVTDEKLKMSGRQGALMTALETLENVEIELDKIRKAASRIKDEFILYLIDMTILAVKRKAISECAEVTPAPTQRNDRLRR